MKRKRGKQRVDHNLRNQESRKIQLCKCALKGAAVWTGICNLIMGHGVHCFNYVHINLRENGDSGKLHFNGTIFIRYFVVGNQPIFLNNEI